jgi:hypothetical protein
MMERRREPRKEIALILLVWGIDTRGERFLQEARARDISLSGALLYELEAELRSGDLVGVLYAGKKARCRVVWVRYCGATRKIQAAIHRIEGDECPWPELLDDATAVSPAVVSEAT